MQLCSKPRGARGIEPETFRRRGQLCKAEDVTCSGSAAHRSSFCLTSSCTLGAEKGASTSTAFTTSMRAPPAGVVEGIMDGPLL